MQHQKGEIVEGKVTGITKFGAFIELEDGTVGMVHISEVSQTYVEDISQHLKENQTVKVKILNIGEDGKISMSIKKALPPTQKPQYRERRQQNFSNNNPRKNTSFNRSQPQPSKPASFEDMLSKFMASSDERMSDLKREKGSNRRGSGGKRSKDFN